MPNRLKAFIRSVFPFVESAAAAFIARHFGHVSTNASEFILGVGGLGLSGVLHWLEGHFPWVGVFLGWIGAPAYAPSAKTVLEQQVANLQAELDAWKSAKAATGTATLDASGSANQVA